MAGSSSRSVLVASALVLRLVSGMAAIVSGSATSASEPEAEARNLVPIGQDSDLDCIAESPSASPGTFKGSRRRAPTTGLDATQLNAIESLTVLCLLLLVTSAVVGRRVPSWTACINVDEQICVM